MSHNHIEEQLSFEFEESEVVVSQSIQRPSEDYDAFELSFIEYFGMKYVGELEG